MPLYTYKCPEGHTFDGYAPMSESSLPRVCDQHLALSEKIITPVRVFGDYEPYEGPVTGRMIYGKRERERDLRESGCRPYEQGEMQDQQHRVADAERQLDKEVDQVVETTLNDLRS